MTSYVLRRLSLAPLFMVAAASIVFLVMRVLPGDPVVAMLGDEASPAAAEALRERAGLNGSLLDQYLDVLGRIVTFDMGTSLASNAPVSDLIVDALPFTLQLVLLSTLVAVGVGVPLGLAAAFRRGTWIDHFATGWVGTVGGTPNYVLGILLLVIFAVQLSWFPVLTPTDVGVWTGPGLRSVALPALALGLSESGSITRICRSAAAALLTHTEFVAALRARGVRERRIKYVHVLRNSLVPVVSVVGAQVATLLGGSIVLEVIFTRPGIGTLLINSLQNRDFVVVESTLLVFSGAVVLVGLLADVAQAWVDPRVSQP